MKSIMRVLLFFIILSSTIIPQVTLVSPANGSIVPISDVIYFTWSFGPEATNGECYYVYFHDETTGAFAGSSGQYYPDNNSDRQGIWYIPGHTYSWYIQKYVPGIPSTIVSETWTFTYGYIIPSFTNLVLQRSSDQTNWNNVSGNLTNGFTASIDPVQGDFHYLNIGNTSTVNTPLAPGYYPFTIIEHPAAMDSYFDGKGVNASAQQGTWQNVLYQIIHGLLPTFYIKVNEDGSMKLVDGLQHLIYPPDDPLYDAYLRINEDYPVGTYWYRGTITGANDITSADIYVSLTITRNVPYFTSLVLQNSSNQTDWADVSGNFNDGFSTQLQPVQGDFYYLNIGNTSTVNTPLAPGYYPFIINTHPEEMDAYFDAKGVNASAQQGTWQNVLYNIIIGQLPTFYIKVNEDGSMKLVDGLQHQIYPSDNPLYDAYLRINDDYPVGTYSYRGTISGANGLTSNIIYVRLTVTRDETVPSFTSLVLQKSSDQTNWTNVSGNLTDGFTTQLQPVQGDFYYLNVGEASTVSTPLLPGYYPFTINTHPAGMDAYFDAKGVNAGSQELWQQLLYKIINGQLPTFYIKVNEDGSMKLIDGLQHQLYPSDNPLYDAYLRINDDYPTGTYTYQGTLNGSNGFNSETINVSLTVTRDETTPSFTSLTLKKSLDLTNWLPINGTLQSGYITHLPPQPDPSAYYYIETDAAQTNVQLAEGYYGFNITGHPDALDVYFDQKGVNAQAAEGTWKYVAYKIITGELPTFYLHVASDGAMTLVDGLTHYLNPADNTTLRINPDYPEGTYTYSGTVTGGNGYQSAPINVSLTINNDVPAFTSIVLQQSHDQLLWTNVFGTLAAGYTAELHPVAGGFYYLNIAGTATNTPVEPGYYGFYISTYPAGFMEYFNAKGVNASAGVDTWQYLTYKIITGELPTFYIKVNSDGSMKLVDGLQHLLYPSDNPLYDAFLRINDDYPAGNYSYYGYLVGQNGKLSEQINISMTFTHEYNSRLLTIGSAESYRGATVVVPVYANFSGSGGIANFMMGKFSYDNTKLRFSRVYAGTGTLINEHGWSLTGYLLPPYSQFGIASAGVNPINDNGILFYIYFEVIGSTAGSTGVTSLPADWILNSGGTFNSIVNGLVTYTVPEGPSTMRGDVTLDFNVDVYDAIAIIFHVYNLGAPLTGQSLINADADLDGVVDVLDALAVFYHIVFGGWDFNIPLPAPTAVNYPDINTDNGIIRIPIALNNRENVSGVSVKLDYDQNVFSYQSFKAASQSTTELSLGSEVQAGSASYVYFDAAAGNTNKNIGELILKVKENTSYIGSKITTQFSINGAEFKPGPQIVFSTTGVEQKDSQIPDNFTVLQNYPNPFNPTTTISFGLPQNEFVTVKIYNALGKEIKTLVNDQMNAGFHSLTWNATDNSSNPVSSGIYIYQIRAGADVRSNKMILLK